MSSQKNKVDLQTNIPQQIGTISSRFVDGEAKAALDKCRHRHLREGAQVWCRVVAFACFQPREEVRFHGGERRRDGKECRECIVHDRHAAENCTSSSSKGSMGATTLTSTVPSAG